MNSLQQLNTLGTTTIDVTDNRFSRVIFDRVTPLQPLTQILEITSTTVSVVPGIEIVEIINYATANVRYRVTIRTGGSPLLTGSSISWASIPAGMTLTTASNVYTISGIDSLTDWNAIRAFTWTLPANFATRPNWYLDVAVLYYDSERTEEMVVDWEVYDEDYYYVAELSSAVTVAATALRIKRSAVTISSAMSFAMTILRAKNFTVSMSSAFTMTPVPVEDLLFAFSNISVTGKKFAGVSSSLSAVSSISASLTELISNLSDRNYTANTFNNLFATNTPVIYDDNSSGATYEIIFSSSIGKFTSSSTIFPTSPASYSGDLASVNAIFDDIRFYPNSGVSSNGTFTFVLKKNSSTLVTRTVNLTGSNVAFTPVTYNITSSQSWSPEITDVIYGLTDILIVGGGGSGSSSPNDVGGGGGGVIELTNQTLSFTTYSLTIGAAGIDGTNNGVGGNTIGFSNTAYGGTMLPIPNVGQKGGTSGAPQSNIGASEFGGGGGGAGGVATDEDGGLGITFNGVIYGAGGGGGASFSGESRGIGGNNINSGAGNGYSLNDVTYGTQSASSGLANRGGGGGGGPISGANTRDGGSGVIIIYVHG
jgi:hypothetical protein